MILKNRLLSLYAKRFVAEIQVALPVVICQAQKGTVLFVQFSLQLDKRRISGEAAKSSPP